ncbi:MAG: 4-(cytidine 5'-diphospho)-2-C-methyl-D-erythritol kinase [Rubrobacteraceae bacterium]|nr:4-(cytidine 5'-diphospho)-2-C-methyl-D-erythritol kinase [Rubrobacter sp.]
MKSIALRAYAKVNYSLDVLGVRRDGYHETRTVLQSVSLFDEVEIEEADRGFSLSVEPREVCPVEENTVYRAWRSLCERVGRELPVRVRLRKNAPSGAGLGGGSADAAAAFVGMNEMFGLGVPDERLRAIAAKVGADVPFCLSGGTILGEGIGDVLTPIPAPPPHFIALAKPASGANTAKVYRAYDGVARESRRDTENVISALRSGGLASLGASVGNGLDFITADFVPEVGEYVSAFLESGALGASMSGTGTSVYGIFDAREKAEASLSKLDAPFSGVFEPMAGGVEVVGHS